VQLDISDKAGLDDLLNRLQPELIVNTAAYTAVDQAEEDSETAFAINAGLPEQLAGWSKQNDARLLHYSTDYVFNGEARNPYRESDEPDPQSVYGASKLAGERVIEAAGCDHVTLRTSWVYSSHGNNFVLSMLRLARRGLALKVVDDQRGCPTWARNLARASIAVIDAWRTPATPQPNGVFHYCDDRDLSWYDFADCIFDLAVEKNLLESKPDLTPVPSREFPQPAKRPAWSVLDTALLAQTFAIQPASFTESLEVVIAEIKKRELR
jgi:dTDP-4-dehydrorhamnose reductase